MVALPEETGLPLAVEGIVPVKVLLAEVAPGVAAVVGPAPETATAAAVHRSFFVVDPEIAVGIAFGTVVVAHPVVGTSVVEAAPETVVGVFVAGIVLGFATAAAVSVVAPVFVALPVSVYFLPEFWQRLLLWQQVCLRQAT